MEGTTAMIRNVGASLIAGLFAAQLLAAGRPAQDDGIAEPYVPPREHSDYVKKLAPNLASTIYADPARIEQWQDDRFGVFMHWDPSCQMTGAVSWSRMGRRPHHPSDGTVTRGISSETYDNLYKTFNPVKFDADATIRMVKDAGARYFVFTAKHHQEFCVFHSAVTNYDIMSSPFKRDICRELADACHRHKVKLFWYYSQPAWHEPRYAAPTDSPQFARYRNEFLHPQLLELYITSARSSWMPANAAAGITSAWARVIGTSRWAARGVGWTGTGPTWFAAPGDGIACEACEQPARIAWPRGRDG